MIRDLTDGEMHELLEKECYGHLACCSDLAKPYLVPITYVYHENAIYSFSFIGTKIDIMRKNPHVCFQAERKHDTTDWRSVMVWGEFEELTGDDREHAFSLILDRLWQESNRDHPIFLPFRNSAETLRKARDEKSVVLYRIVMKEKTGRMEQYES
jgi:nitroimidazol reductase NimA-like FMN-containing flavoprotein (pyridoxamine 5'-phosphate oxidase superfamily)